MITSPLVSVIIKTLNEEQGIVKTIQNIRAHLQDIPHQIIVADSLSTDSTQQLAIAENVDVISLINAEDRCCGVGHQLGYLHCDGEFLLLFDGDNELVDGFVQKGLTFLKNNLAYAGVAGTINIDEGESYEFKSRKQRVSSIYPLGDCNHLGSGGLYRKSSIDEIGYLTNKNLHACEEAELGLRLGYAGFKLHRLDTPFFRHMPFTIEYATLIKQRWKGRRLDGPGELLRATFSEGYFIEAVKYVKNEVVFTGYLFCLILALLTFNLPLILVAFFPFILFLGFKSKQNKSFSDAIKSVVMLIGFSAGLVRGFITKQDSPYIAPENKIIHKAKR